MNAITVGLILEHRMLVDTLTAWFHRRAPADIHLVAAATNTTIQGDLADANVIIAERPTLTALTPSAANAAAIVLLVDDIGAEEFDDKRVRAYVASTDEVDVLPDAIRTAAGSATSQTPFYSPQITEVIGPKALRPAEVPENAVILTAKQRRVLNLYVDGLTGQDIAEQLGMARNTVRSYIRNIRGKYRTAGFPVRNKIELVHAAHSPATITKPRTIRMNATPDATPRVEESKACRDAEEALPLPRPAAPPALSPTMTVADLSRIFGLDEKTVRKHLGNGTIPAYRVRHHWLIFTAEVRALFDDPEKPADSTAAIDILASYGETITPREIQALFQSSRQTINLWLKQGILPGYWIGTRWLIHTHQLRHALIAYSNQNSPPPVAEVTD